MAILEHTIGHRPENASESDPFGIAFDDLVNFINLIGDGKFYVAQVLDEFDFAVPDYYGRLKYLVTRNQDSINGST